MATGTQFYTDPDNSPAVSPAFDSVWDDTSNAIRGKLTWTYPDTYESLVQSETSGSPYYQLFFQFVSPKLQAISAALADFNAVMGGCQLDNQTNAYFHYVIRKCDGDGSNPVTIDSITDDTELDYNDPVTYTYERRWCGGSIDLTNQSFNDEDRLIVEVGLYYDNTKTDSKDGRVVAAGYEETLSAETDSGTFLTTSSWISTGDTFTEYVPPTVVYANSVSVEITTHAVTFGGDVTYQVPAALNVQVSPQTPTIKFDYNYQVSAPVTVQITTHPPVFNETVQVGSALSIQITPQPATVGADVTYQVPAALSLQITPNAAVAGEVVIFQVSSALSLQITPNAATVDTPDYTHFPGTVSVEITTHEAFIKYDFDTTIEPYFIFELAGSPDLIIPIDTFQARMRTGVKSSLKVRIPGIEYQSDIEARDGGEMRIYAVYENKAGVIESQELIAFADLTTIKVIEGIAVIDLEGSKAAEFGGHERQIEGVTYRTASRGQTRIRTAILNPFLRPGDMVETFEDTFTADEIVYTISGNRRTMEIAEADY